MTRRPFSLSAYLAFARGRTSSAVAEPDQPRPAGPIIWAQAGTPGSARPLAALLSRLQMQRPDLSLLVTGDSACAPPGAIATDLPGESQPEVTGFATHWRPAIGFWTGQHLRPALLHTLKARGTKLVLLDARDAQWTTPAPGWMPDAAPATLSLFDRAYGVDDAARRRLRRAGLPEDRLPRTGLLTETAPPLDYPRRAHEELVAAFAARPVWLAARVRTAEAEQVLDAHLRAVRLAHRLLLILVPAEGEDAAAIADRARASDLRLCLWDNGEMPDETTQMILTETPGELGLWYRLAPLVFLGGSLVPGHGGEDPLEAAVHGTALLYGPNVGRHLPAYSRLAEAGAARIVRDFDSLSAAVSQLIAPDRAAAMAHAGWDVVSQGAALTDELLTLAGDWLDTGEAA
ncbi:3-deoxy-D-manno-octulosonic acid transferase [Salipiger manganoxidans]|nr:3-deoxy-D-manno-octulosonic acid transferase [Salipiger manganoxidans]